MATRKKKKTARKIIPLDADIQVTLEQIEAEFGKGTIMRMGTMGHVDAPSIPTGSLALDIDLGIGGMPQGRIVEVYGPESSGKTTLCASIVANAQKSGGLCAFIDVEHALDPVWLTTLGCDLDNILISQPDCGEDALSIAEKLIQSHKVAVVVVDSVAALTPRAEIEGQMGDSHVGLQARLMSQALRKLNGEVCKSNTCLIFTNQIREKIGVMFGNPETTSGGNALKFYASIRMRLSRGEKIKEAGSTDEDGPIGNQVKYNIVKNKMAAPFRKGTFDILYDSGINHSYSLVTVGVELGVIEKRGSWFSYGEEQLGQGKVGAVSALMDDEKLRMLIDNEIRIEAGLIKDPKESEVPKEETKPATDVAKGDAGDESK